LQNHASHPKQWDVPFTSCIYTWPANSC
jgi:hypothetical protein